MGLFVLLYWYFKMSIYFPRLRVYSMLYYWLWLIIWGLLTCFLYLWYLCKLEFKHFVELMLVLFKYFNRDSWRSIKLPYAMRFGQFHRPICTKFLCWHLIYMIYCALLNNLAEFRLFCCMCEMKLVICQVIIAWNANLKRNIYQIRWVFCWCLMRHRLMGILIWLLVCV